MNELSRVTIMLGQVADGFRYNGVEFSLVGINGKGFYTRADFGLQTTMASTASWRGYQMFYHCLDGDLILDSMFANPIETITFEPCQLYCISFLSMSSANAVKNRYIFNSQYAVNRR